MSFLAWHPARREGLGLALSALEQSIVMELDRLLNTRCAASLEQLASRTRGVLDYGLPDYSALHSDNVEHCRLLAALVQSTVAAFEPRLHGVEVDVAPMPNSRMALDVTVRGTVLAEGRLEPVSFRIPVKETA